MPAQQSAQFKKAVEKSRNIGEEVDGKRKEPTSDQMLTLYALFKEGTQDPLLEDSPKPGMFDLKGKAKRKAWEDQHAKKLTPKAAQEAYVAEVAKLIKQYGEYKK